MGRATRTRRPLNREPTSLAGAALIAGASGENEAIDTIETVTPDSNINPALTTYEIDHPPPPSQSFDTLDPIYDPYPSNDLQYPSHSPIQDGLISLGREVTWSTTPPPRVY